MIVQPFPSFFFPLVLWRLLTSCSSLLLRFPVCKTSSGKRYHLHLIYLLYLRPEISCSIGLCSGLRTRPSQIRLHIQFLFVRPRFCPRLHFSASTSGFFQILPHDRHPCLRLTVPTAKSVVDFHHQVATHAEHTTQNGLLQICNSPFAIFITVNLKFNLFAVFYSFSEFCGCTEQNIA